jgi:tripartite-type tricarboxylate transporter receptor subunit TctC
MKSFRCLPLLAAAAVIAATAAPVLAQPFPSKSIRLILPYPPGGGSDTIARPVARKMTENTGQQVIVDNRGGAGGNLGTSAVATAPADGNTLLIVSVGMATNQFLYPRLDYHPVNDFQPVSLIAMVPNVLVVGRHVQANTVGELLAFSRANPGRLTYGSSGIGTSVHLSGELFQRMTNTRMEHVPYRGTAQATQDLIGGRIDLIFDNISQALPHIRSGNLKALGITTARRSPFAPELAPVSDTVPGFDVTSWFGFFVRRGTDMAIVQKMAADTRTALQDAGVQQRLGALAAEPAGGTPEDLAAFLARETEMWGRVIREGNIRAE